VDGQEKSFHINYLKRFLEGEWRLERRIDDRRAGQQGRFDGEAVFFADEEDLLYREDGHLAIGDHEGPALQLYTFRFPESGRAEVCFSDGRPFHDLDLTGGRWSCVHLCEPDRYEGEFTALDADTWRVVWKVSGPRKELTLDSTYRRAL